MKGSKRFIPLALVLIMLIGVLTSCSGSQSTTPGANASPSATTSGSSNNTSNANNSSGTGNSGGSNNQDRTYNPGSTDIPTGDGIKFKDDITFIIDLPVVSLNRFNPGQDNPNSQTVYLCVYDRLVDKTADGGYIPMLATEWHTDDWKVYDLKLRNDVYFHNGEHFTADDVVYTVERAAQSPGTNACDNIGRNVDKVEAISDFEVKITLKDVNVDYIGCLAHPSSAIANRKACEADPEEGVKIGTGPWVVDSIVSGDYVSLTRNDKYWGIVPVTKKLTFKFVPEEAARMMMLENGEAELALGTNYNTDYPYLESDSKFTAFSILTANPHFVGFNMNDPITGDLNFRKAVASLIDKVKWAQMSRNGYAVPYLDDGAFWAFGTEFRNTDIPVIPYDVAKAKEYLAQSSYKGEEVSITAALPNQLVFAQLLIEELRGIGVTAVLNQTDPPGMNAATAYGDNHTQIVCHLFTWDSGPATVRSIYYPGAAQNRASYNNPDVTKLLDLAPTQTNDTEREQTYKQIQALTAEDIPYVAVQSPITILGALKGVGGVEMRTDNTYRMSYVYMIVQ